MNQTTLRRALLVVITALCSPMAGAQTLAWREGARPLDTPQYSPRRPEIASDGNRAVAVWGLDRVWISHVTEQSPRWSAPYPLDDGRGPVHSAQIALSGLYATALWRQTIGGTQYVMSAASADSGRTWTSPAVLAASANFAPDYPRLALAGKTAVAAWCVAEEAGVNILTSARSTDGGQNWSAPVVITKGSIRDFVLNASTAARLVCIWTQDGYDGGGLLASVSDDGGATWRQPSHIADLSANVLGGAWAYLPALAAEDHLAAALWCQQEDSLPGLFYSISTNAGATWATPRRVGSGAFPRLRVNGGKVLCAWSQGDRLVVVGGPAEDSVHWEVNQTVSAGNSFLDNPTLVANGRRALLLWRQGFSIWGSHSSDFGATWQSPQILETLETTSWYPNGALVGSRSVALWMQWMPDTWLPFGNWADKTTDSWQGAHIIAAGAGNALDPALVIDGNRVLAMWTVHNGTNSHISVASSADGGQTWSPMAIAAGNLGSGVGTPALALGGSRAIAVWSINQEAKGAGIAALVSTNSGLTWNVPTMLANDVQARLVAPAVAAEGLQVVTVWQHMGRGAANIKIACSEDGGITWREAKPTDADSGATEPAVAISGRLVLLTWTRRDTGGISSIWGALSADGGSTWGAPMRFDSGGGANSVADAHSLPCPKGRCLCPLEGRPSCRPSNVGHSAIAAKGHRLLVVWHQRDNGKTNRIYARASADGGRSWTPLARITAGYGNAWAAQPVFLGEQAAVFWRQREEKQDALYVAVSDDGGATWSASRRISDGITDAPLPSPDANIYTQVNAFQRTSNVAPSSMAFGGFYAAASRIIRGAGWWALLINTGTTSVSNTK